jgi:hypothetical protein
VLVAAGDWFCVCFLVSLSLVSEVPDCFVFSRCCNSIKEQVEYPSWGSANRNDAIRNWEFL